MPELPEVETVVRAVRPSLIGRVIVALHNDWPRHIVTHTPDQLAALIVGRRIVSLTRRAKYIVFGLDGGDCLILHLRMSGHLAVVAADAPADRHVHTRFALDDGRELRFRDVRKFGTVAWTAEPDALLGKLGPEPLADDFTPEVLASRLAGRRTMLKPLLLDQTCLAGVGNIYADEALFAAGLDPRRPAAELTSAEIARLHKAIRDVLALGIAREGASIDSYVKPDGEKGDMQNAVMVFRRTGLPCYTCGTPIARIKLAQRSTHFCPRCQAGGVAAERGA